MSKTINDPPNHISLESEVREKFKNITRSLIDKKLTITTMESCTSGLIASLITDTEGASAILKGAYITYSNEAKIMCGVSEKTIGTYGVYSAETAEEMAKNAMRLLSSDIAIGVTGTMENTDPVNHDSVPGEVHFAIATKHCTKTFKTNIPVQKNRFEYKLYVANIISDKLGILIDSL